MKIQTVLMASLILLTGTTALAEPGMVPKTAEFNTEFGWLPPRPQPDWQGLGGYTEPQWVAYMLQEYQKSYQPAVSSFLGGLQNGASLTAFNSKVMTHSSGQRIIGLKGTVAFLEPSPDQINYFEAVPETVTWIHQNPAGGCSGFRYPEVVQSFVSQILDDLKNPLNNGFITSYTPPQTVRDPDCLNGENEIAVQTTVTYKRWRRLQNLPVPIPINPGPTPLPTPIEPALAQKGTANVISVYRNDWNATHGMIVTLGTSGQITPQNCKAISLNVIGDLLDILSESRGNGSVYAFYNGRGSCFMSMSLDLPSANKIAANPYVVNIEVDYNNSVGNR